MISLLNLKDYHLWFGITTTVIAYTIAISIHRRWTWIHPLFVCSGLLMLLLWLFHIPYPLYQKGSQILSFLLGPATVALAVPLYQYRHMIKKYLPAIIPGIIIGSVSGTLSVIALVNLFGGTREIWLSMSPKSSTSPIAIEIAKHLGAIPELSAVFAVLTGLLGSMIGKTALRFFGITSDVSVGTAIGTSAHGIGTAKIIRDSEQLGGLSSFAMTITGILLSILFIPLYYFI